MNAQCHIFPYIFNTGECVEKWTNPNTEYSYFSQYNNQKDCEANKGLWLEFTNYLEKAQRFKNQSSCEAASKNGIRYGWGRPLGSMEKECLVLLDAPDCQQAPYSRDNHLGNGINAQHLSYKWTIPYFPSEEVQRCVIRIR